MHRFVLDSGADYEAALDAYGRERIGPNDLVMIVALLAPAGGAYGHA